MNQAQQPDSKPGAYYVSVARGADYRLIAGPFIIRIICEAIIVVFEINNTLTEIRDEQRRQAVAAMFKPEPVSITTPPVV